MLFENIFRLINFRLLWKEDVICCFVLMFCLCYRTWVPTAFSKDKGFESSSAGSKVYKKKRKHNNSLSSILIPLMDPLNKPLNRQAPCRSQNVDPPLFDVLSLLTPPAFPSKTIASGRTIRKVFDKPNC